MASAAPNPLKVNAAPSDTAGGSSKQSAKSSTAPETAPPSSSATVIPTSDIASPHELTAYVEKVLEQLDARFDEMSTQVLDRMSQMASRVDALEASIQDIIATGDATGPATPSIGTPASSTVRRTTST